MNINLGKISSHVISPDDFKISNAALMKVPEKLARDTVDFSIPQNIVKVYNSLFKKITTTEKIVSPEFNGCHGVGILAGDEMFFAHFPLHCKNRMLASIEDGLKQFSSSGTANVIFVSPVSKQGIRESAFDDYLSLIKKRFGENIELETLEYPSRSKGATYKYTGVIQNGKIKNTLNCVQRDGRR